MQRQYETIGTKEGLDIEKEGGGDHFIHETLSTLHSRYIE